jgi:hypothetical protein
VPQLIAAMTFTNDYLVPAFQVDDALELAVRLAPSTVYPLGQVLGEAQTSANDVQTFTATGTPTGGSMTYAVTNPLTNVVSNLAIPYNCSAASLQTLANAILGSGNIVAGGGPWPGTPLTLTATGATSGLPITVAVAGTNAFTGGSAPASSVAHTTTGVQAGDMAAYNGPVAAPVAPTVAGNGTGSSFGAGTYLVEVSYKTALGESTPSPAVAVTLTAAQNIRVTAIASIPTGVTSVNYYVDGELEANTAVSAGTAAQTDIVGTTPAISGVPERTNRAFTVRPACLLKYPCATDALGNITLGNTSGGGFHGQTQLTVPAYFRGIFDTARIVGLDASAVAILGRIYRGTTSVGLLGVF